jgi:hypothetical protein
MLGVCVIRSPRYSPIASITGPPVTIWLAAAIRPGGGCTCRPTMDPSDQLAAPASKAAAASGCARRLTCAFM